MKIQCSGCDAAEARVFCCADEAALCNGCDDKIHAANKLVGKHYRVPLSASTTPLPKCDICQETSAYLLCLEDRALLCRKCDVAIHTMNSSVSSHQRFLLTGVKVGLESAMFGKSTEKTTAHMSTSTTNRNSSARLHPEAKASKDGDVVESWSNVAPKMPVACGTDSRFTQVLGLTGCNQNQSSGPDGLSKADVKVHGNSEWLKILRSTEEQLLNDEWEVPDDVSCTVPELLHPYTQPDSSSPREATKLSASNNVFNIYHAGLPSRGDSQDRVGSFSTKRQSRQRRKT